jgi:CHC2 zinc finger
MGEFIKERLPDPVQFFADEGVPLTGQGRWKTGPCHFHDGSDSLRVNTSTGGWVCMACGVKGGDVLAYLIERDGLGFVAAAKALGAYVDDGKPHSCPARPTILPARDAMQLIAIEWLITVCVIAKIRAGLIPSDADWLRFVEAAGRAQTLAEEFA